MNRFYVSIFFLLALPFAINAQSYVQLKNYPFLTLLQNDKQAAKLIEKDTMLSRIRITQLANATDKLATQAPVAIVTSALKFSPSEIAAVKAAFSRLFPNGSAIELQLRNKLVATGKYSLYEQKAGEALLATAWVLEAESINHTIAVYAEGLKPNYPAIDSIRFNVRKPADQQILLKQAKETIADNSKQKLFFELSMNAALDYLDLNKRNDAGDYEPMAQKENKAAVKQIAKTDWKKYPYSYILVPGEGPEDNASISPGGKLRCRLAAEQFQKGLAPFVMVSGGKVHPFGTPWCEAVEMKRFLIDSLHIPATAIIIEPHARHTTTNLRNAVRLMYFYKIPADKPAIALTDQMQSLYISNLAPRCMKELGYVPYTLGKRLSSTMQEFMPVWTAMQVNGSEPLDP